MAGRRCLNRLAVSIIFFFVSLPSIAILGNPAQGSAPLAFPPVAFSSFPRCPAAPTARRRGIASAEVGGGRAGWGATRRRRVRLEVGSQRDSAPPVPPLSPAEARAARGFLGRPRGVPSLPPLPHPAARGLCNCWPGSPPVEPRSSLRRRKRKRKKKGAGGVAPEEEEEEEDSVVTGRKRSQRRQKQEAGAEAEAEAEAGAGAEAGTGAGAEAGGGAMSNVRVSNGSPTLERMEARQSEYPKPSACRSLFGPVNHEELGRDLQRHRAEMEAACQRQWNFDFQHHKPLAGRFEWQAVEEGSSPDFYFRAPRRPKAPCRAAPPGGLDVNANRPARTVVGSQGISADTRFADQNSEASANQTDLAEQCAGQRKRPAAEDSSPQPKRANTTEEVSEESPSASSVEQTPKKSSPKRCQT